jgi:hypothetical protein
LPFGVTICPHAGKGRLWQAIKLALDVCYDLREKTGSEGAPDSDEHPDEGDLYNPRREDYLAWVRVKEARSDSR